MRFRRFLPIRRRWPTLQTILSLWFSVACFANAHAQTNFTILKSFGTLPGAAVPFGGLVADSNLVLYGTTVAGGVATQGVVFSIHSDGTGYSTVKEFVGSTNPMTPYGELTLGHDGRLYGTSYSGGISNFGTVFGLNTDGSGFAVLHSFTGGADGKNPKVGLTEASDGTLYGVTYFANSADRGTIFKINKDGTGYSVMHVFTGNPDGQQVQCKLLEGSDGALYGTTQYGGTTTAGTIFTINKNGTGYGILFNLGSVTAGGYIASSGVIEGSDHFLYGTTGLGGGTGNQGTLYKVDKYGGNYQVLQRFPQNSSAGGSAGGGLIEGANGMIYGLTQHGGIESEGTVFCINEDGSGYAILLNFLNSGADINQPVSPLLQLPNGIFYGTVPYGGPESTGGIYALSQSPFPPRLSLPSISAGSNVFQVSATSYIQYDVQRSTNLSSWDTLGTLLSPVGGQTNYSDTTPPSSAAFYRLHQH